MSVKPIPEGYRTITPYLVVKNAAQLIDFLKQAFEAQEISRFPHPNGSVGHAEMKIGDSIIMLGEVCNQWTEMPAALYLYINDVDATYQRALQAGATSVLEPKDQFYGDRSATIKDFAGNQWTIATHMEDVAPEEMKKRAEAAMASAAH